jgi:hypothetical protein
MRQRRFPPPWTADELTESFVVKDASGQALCHRSTLRLFIEIEVGER